MASIPFSILFLLLLPTFCVGAINGDNLKQDYHPSCEKDNEIVICTDETFDRFGCCFKLVENPVEGTHHLWNRYEDIRISNTKNETFTLPIEYCDPDKPIDNQCNKVVNFPSPNNKEIIVHADMKSLYGQLHPPQEVICAALTPSEAFTIDNNVVSTKKTQFTGRCRSVKERKVVKSKFYGKRLHVRADWAEFVDNGKKTSCNYDAYVQKGIKQLLERYLLCPFDTEYLDTEFNKLLEDAYFLPKMLEELCLATPNLEECVPILKEDGEIDQLDGKTKGKCECFKKTWRIRRSADEVFVWNITQLDERHRCTQAVGSTCTFNANDMIKLQDTSEFIPKANPDEEVSPSVLYGICDVTGPIISNLTVLPDLTCEQDAACESVLKPKKKCLAADDCKCICAVGHECSISGGVAVGGSSLRSVLRITLFSVVVFIVGKKYSL